MSTQNVDPPVKPEPPAAAAAPKPPSGIRTVLRYTGIPVSWLDKKPKLPSRNWMIFLSITSTCIGYYAYDRRQCRRIKQEYIDKVKDLAEERLNPLEPPRKVTVYGAKWPGDEDYDQALKYFRKYVKPILVAAAIDFDMIHGKRQGDIARRVAEDTRKRRRLDLGIDQPSEAAKLLPTYKPVEEVRRRELEGGIVIVGRHTFKEFMVGLKRGWTRGLNKVDEDEELSKILDEDHHFDEVDDSEDSTASNPASHSPVFSMSTYKAPKEQETSTDNQDAPATIPQLPPLLLVPFHNRIGLTQIPLMIWDWFNRRKWVQSGAEAGYRLVMAQTRPIDVPLRLSEEESTLDSTAESNNGDLDFDKDADLLFKKSLHKIEEETEKERASYYKKLPAKLETARALARGTREPTKDELSTPPPTEVELRAERLKKERRWRNDVESWNLIKPSASVEWDERLRDALRVFTDPSKSA
ncbi:mitochondrial import inner membrane translocase subunit TIM54 [Coprinopsis cinerea okayama7|uniref:Mitochondrial import inner membrane translocase subunit TIM54 n=1 Tax=Coprinopsis cinerea (strain Okayama-7 / 130 / ATCC MYA-4618 / FGSC 9003) TaxID=240176 RepID=D6RKF4_COPC7|nr:mitochondrial import inner membrane translocase subunit TIM54 [Coprinopsis cinerea okayama7\|eukprot:XP_002911829.1 mitochondrial import inner membrane translocase subunit TIM54 [Coprinopsis cinerea okayama7\